MARPPLLNEAQQAALRQAALAMRAATPYRGRGSVVGATGANATQRLVDLVLDRWRIEMTERSMQRILNRLGLVYEHRAQGGFWIEARR